MQRWSCGPVWEFADRNQIINARCRHDEYIWFFRPRLADCCAIPSFDHYTCDDLRSARLTPWLRWRARRSPACAVCEPASDQATNPSGRRVCSPEARRCRHFPRSGKCHYRKSWDRPVNSRGQLLQKRFRLLQVARVEPLCEPAVNRSQQFPRLLHLPLVAPETRKAHSGAEFPGFGVLRAGD